MTDKQKANLLESIATAVLLTDKQFKIVYANTAAEQLCGVSRSKLKYQKLTDLIDSTENSLLQTIADTNFTDSFQGFSAADILFSPSPGKSTKADLTVFNYSSDSFPDGLLVEIHTISHQEKLINQVQQNYQYTAARDLIRSLAHEIKNPLGGIRGAAQLIEMTFGKVAGIKDYTKVIIDQTDRLKILVNNLLGPQKPNPLEKENVHFLIEKVMSLVSMEEESKNIQFKRDYDPSLPELNLDANSIEQVLLNIINNAIQALNDSATKDPVITIKTRASIRTIVREKKYPTAIIISISNNGPEIPEHIKQTVFFPMVTTKAHGNGLGLSIALNIIERHEGTIECLSDAHKTEFRIILPIKSRIQGES